MILGPSALRKLFRIVATHHSKDSSFLGRIQQEIRKQEIVIMAEELYPWRCLTCDHINKKVATECARCHSFWTTGVRHNTEPKATTYKASTYREAWPSDTQHPSWDDWDESDRSWQWTSSAANRSSTRSQSPRHLKGSQSPRGRKGKGKGGFSKGKNQNKSKGQTEQAASPFAPLTKETQQWPALDDQSSATPFQTSSSITTSLELLNQKKECLAALKAAYPDGNPPPPETKELMEKLEKEVDKLEKESSRFTTKSIHAATKNLGKAQKVLTDTLEAKKTHRVRWMKHITEAVETWQGQLRDYRNQQQAFQKVATKAKADIETARASIQALSSNATPAALAAMPKIATIQEENITEEIDPEEEKLHGQLQDVLQKCAATLKTEPLEEKWQDLTMEEEEEPDRERKRPRSLEPFAQSAQPGALSANAGRM